jgi:hypothetical protein
MENERDPRVDPKPGDVLEVKPGCCLFRHVAIARANIVGYASRCGNQWFNTTFRDTLVDWREVMKDAKVIHRAD